MSDDGGVHLYRGRDLSAPLVSIKRLSIYLREAALAAGDQPFMTEMRGERDVTISYGDLFSKVLACAGHLRSCFDLRDDENVALLPVNGITSIVYFFAALHCGANVNIISPDQSSTRAVEQITQLNPRLIICPEDFECNTERIDILPFKPDRPPAWIVKDQSLTESSSFEAEVRLFTTGSTAASKIVRLTQYNLIVNAIALVRHHSLSRNSRIFTANPIYYANALGFAVIASLLAKGRVYIATEFDPFEFLKQAYRAEATIVNMVPPMLDALLQGRMRAWPPGLSYVVTAASPLMRRTAERAFARDNIRIVQGYGLTETTNFSLVMPVNLSREKYIEVMIERDIPPVGAPLFGCEVLLVRGELCMRGHSVMRGYYRNQAATDDAFRDNIFHSGDLGQVDTATFDYPIFTITGRSKNVAKVHGIGISLEEVERSLTELPDLEDVAISIAPSENGDDLLYANYVSTRREIAVGEFNRLITTKVGAQGKISGVNKLTSLPRFKNGKIDRVRLKRDYKDEG